MKRGIDQNSLLVAPPSLLPNQISQSLNQILELLVLFFHIVKLIVIVIILAAPSRRAIFHETKKSGVQIAPPSSSSSSSRRRRSSAYSSDYESSDTPDTLALSIRELEAMAATVKTRVSLLDLEVEWSSENTI